MKLIVQWPQPPPAHPGGSVESPSATIPAGLSVLRAEPQLRETLLLDWWSGAPPVWTWWICPVEGREEQAGHCCLGTGSCLGIWDGGSHRKHCSRSGEKDSTSGKIQGGKQGMAPRCANWEMSETGRGKQKEVSEEGASSEVSKQRDPLSVSVVDKASQSGHILLLAAEFRELLNSPA